MLSKSMIALLSTLLLATPAGAVDYDKIDRSIRKEPKYSGKPEYALLVFGADARRLVWMVIDGETFYIDRNGDGDLTSSDEKFNQADEWKNVEIRGLDGSTRYVLTQSRVHRDNENRWPPSLMVYVDIHSQTNYQQYCDVQLGATPREAGIAHFHGPLAIGPRTIDWKVPPETSLKTGDKPEDLSAMIGTMSGRHKCWVVVVSHKSQTECCFPDGVRPKATVEYASNEQGAPPVVAEYSLDEFC
ncbi:MAG: hypothetical protein ACREHD_26865 [Pirellulales bacterium]